MAPWDVYAKELSIFSRGHAVLNPRRSILQDGSGLRPAVDVGNVVYNLEGQLIRLFNCLRPREQQDADCVFPHDFEVLRIARSSEDDESCFREINIQAGFYRPGPFISKGVKSLKAEAVASATSEDDARLSFSTHHEQGAVLLTTGRVLSRQSPNRPSFERYLIQHFDSWCALLESAELDIRPEDLMLITGLDKTESWSNICFEESWVQGEFTVDVPSVDSVDFSPGAGVNTYHACSAFSDSGPNPEDMEVRIHLPSGHDDGKLLSDDERVNQVIFVRALRGKKRNFNKGVKVVGNAGSGGVSDDAPPSDDGSSYISVESIGDTQHRDDYMIPVLDFILEEFPNVDMAIVHDDDYAVHNQHMQAPSGLVRRRLENGIMIGRSSSLNVDRF
ncbi:hypothetical protein PENSPDRAFT_686259 [Peniophora sp. CONT]|nr:hypothetical protein PENSPDRAFT_686259 [Peniophora sp. CONT]